MTMVLSAHDTIWFRRSYLGWEVHQVFLRGAELFYIELIEELPADTVRWALRRAGSRAILSKRGILERVDQDATGATIWMRAMLGGRPEGRA